VPSDDDDDLFGASIDPEISERQKEMLAGLSRWPSYYESYEEGRVRYLLKFLFPKTANVLEKQIRNKNGSDLTFAGFSDEYPSFPVVLGAIKPSTGLHIDESCFLPNLFNNFTKSTIFKLFDKFFEDNYERIAKRPAGVVLQRKGFPHGMVVHTFQGLSFIGPVLMWPLVSEKDTKHIYLHRFDNFLVSVRETGWTP